MKNNLSIYGGLTAAFTVFAVALLVSCLVGEEPKKQSETPIFSQVEKIEIDQSSESMNASTGELMYELPDGVKYAIVEMFEGQVVADDEKKIVSTENLVAGSRTGLESLGFDRGKIAVKKLLRVKDDKSDFDFETPQYYDVAAEGSGDYFWAVLGFDSGLNLTHASPAWEVTINWDG